MPLWLACLLRKRKMCTVEAPPWLGPKRWSRRATPNEGPRRGPGAAGALVEVAALLLECAGDDLAAGLRRRDRLRTGERPRTSRRARGQGPRGHAGGGAPACADEHVLGEDERRERDGDYHGARAPSRRSAPYATRPSGGGGAARAAAGGAAPARTLAARRRSSPAPGRVPRTHAP